MIEKVIADPVFYERQSPRSFTDRIVSEKTLMSMFEAARWAPSSFNEQPWRFIYSIKGDKDTGKLYDDLLSCLNEKNQEWAEEAPVLLMTVAKTTFSKTGKPNRHAWHDVGLAMGNFSIQATKDDVIVHQMAGFSPEKAAETFNLSGDFEPVAMAAIGYPAEKKADRERKSLEELIFNSELTSS